jgi:hypothetical protein
VLFGCVAKVSEKMRLRILDPGDRPVVVWAGGPLLLTGSLMALLFWILVIVDVALDPTRHSVTTVAGLELSGLWQNLSITPLVVLLIGAKALIGYGLIMRKAWARLLATFYGIVAGILIGGAYMLTQTHWANGALAILQGCATTSVAYWYFYRKRNVVEYFAGIE